LKNSKPRKKQIKLKKEDIIKKDKKFYVNLKMTISHSFEIDKDNFFLDKLNKDDIKKYFASNGANVAITQLSEAHNTGMIPPENVKVDILVTDNNGGENER